MASDICQACGEAHGATVALAAANDTTALQRKQLRNAWAKLECRCIFNEADEKTHEDPHCPYHGWQQNDPDGWDPIGDLRREIETLRIGIANRDLLIKKADEQSVAKEKHDA